MTTITHTGIAILRSSSLLTVALCVSLASGCAREDVSGPDQGTSEQHLFSRLEINPDSLVLLPTNTRQLAVTAWDQYGTNIPETGARSGREWEGKITYSSSDPEVAAVDTKGLVTAVAPGKAAITTTLTLGGVKQSATISATVAKPVFVAGVYDLTAPIVRFDPAWGDYTGYSYRAVITFLPGGMLGTWEDMRFFDPTGKADFTVSQGFINSFVNSAGQVVNKFGTGDYTFSLVNAVQDELDSRLVTGAWGCCVGTSGKFTARRRE